MLVPWLPLAIFAGIAQNFFFFFFFINNVGNQFVWCYLTIFNFAIYIFFKNKNAIRTIKFIFIRSHFLT
jgi:hypothetical protein